MLAWVTIDRQHKPYLSPIFARAIHKGIGMKLLLKVIKPRYYLKNLGEAK